jgi:hypothetical protein
MVIFVPNFMESSSERVFVDILGTRKTSMIRYISITCFELLAFFFDGFALFACLRKFMPLDDLLTMHRTELEF